MKGLTACMDYREEYARKIFMGFGKMGTMCFNEVFRVNGQTIKLMVYFIKGLFFFTTGREAEIVKNMCPV